ncbi:MULTISPECIES: hypothetical protein [Streptomyces]|uniref:hypothetical protein n=1 Tax=Streptomyces TaxID=1883 RepID=UPI0031EF7524
MPGAVGPGDLVTVTHRPHPLVGRRLLVRAVRGGSAEKLLCERPGGGLVTILRSWTDRAPGARPVQHREPRGEVRREPRPGTRAGDGGAAFQVSDTALRRLRASLALSVERFVGLDTAQSTTVAAIPRPSPRHFSAGEKAGADFSPCEKGRKKLS